jgi:hypothetical protein
MIFESARHQKFPSLWHPHLAQLTKCVSFCHLGSADHFEESALLLPAKPNAVRAEILGEEVQPRNGWESVIGVGVWGIYWQAFGEAFEMCRFVEDILEAVSGEMWAVSRLGLARAFFQPQLHFAILISSTRLTNDTRFHEAPDNC